MINSNDTAFHAQNTGIGSVASPRSFGTTSRTAIQDANEGVFEPKHVQKTTARQHSTNLYDAFEEDASLGQTAADMSELGSLLGEFVKEDVIKTNEELALKGRVMQGESLGTAEVVAEMKRNPFVSAFIGEAPAYRAAQEKAADNNYRQWMMDMKQDSTNWSDKSPEEYAAYMAEKSRNYLDNIEDKDVRNSLLSKMHAEGSGIESLGAEQRKNYIAHSANELQIQNQRGSELEYLEISDDWRSTDPERRAAGTARYQDSLTTVMPGQTEDQHMAMHYGNISNAIQRGDMLGYSVARSTPDFFSRLTQEQRLELDNMAMSQGNTQWEIHKNYAEEALFSLPADYTEADVDAVLSDVASQMSALVGADGTRGGSLPPGVDKEELKSRWIKWAAQKKSAAVSSISDREVVYSEREHAYWQDEYEKMKNGEENALATYQDDPVTGKKIISIHEYGSAVLGFDKNTNAGRRQIQKASNDYREKQPHVAAKNRAVERQATGLDSDMVLGTEDRMDVNKRSTDKLLSTTEAEFTRNTGMTKEDNPVEYSKFTTDKIIPIITKWPGVSPQVKDQLTSQLNISSAIIVNSAGKEQVNPAFVSGLYTVQAIRDHGGEAAVREYLGDNYAAVVSIETRMRVGSDHLAAVKGKQSVDRQAAGGKIAKVNPNSGEIKSLISGGWLSSGLAGELGEEVVGAEGSVLRQRTTQAIATLADQIMADNPSIPPEEAITQAGSLIADNGYRNGMVYSRNDVATKFDVPIKNVNQVFDFAENAVAENVAGADAGQVVSVDSTGVWLQATANGIALGGAQHFTFAEISEDYSGTRKALAKKRADERKELLKKRHSYYGTHNTSISEAIAEESGVQI